MRGRIITGIRGSAIPYRQKPCPCHKARTGLRDPTSRILQQFLETQSKIEQQSNQVVNRPFQLLSAAVTKILVFPFKCDAAPWTHWVGSPRLKQAYFDHRHGLPVVPFPSDFSALLHLWEQFRAKANRYQPVFRLHFPL